MSIDYSKVKGLTIPVTTKRVTLTNLVPAMSSLTFSVGSSSGTCEMSTVHTKYGSTALCNTGVSGYSEMYVVSSQKFQLIPDHFYYACVEVYQETKLGSVDYFWPSGSPSMFGGQSTGNAGTWKKCSNVTNRTSFTAGEYPVRLDFNNGGTAGKMWYDGLMLIDLTEAFGAGNEPGNAWCQENIPYFTDTMELGWKFTNLAPAINGTTGLTTWGSGGTFSAESSTTHTKYATQSLKMSIGSDCAEACANSANTYPLDSSHVYYARVEAYQEVASGTMEIYFPIAEPHMFNTPAKEAGKWNIYSAVCDRNAFSSGNYNFRLDFNRGPNGQSGEVWYDGLMLVDLTAACGAGNEPSQEWCDANIPYFTGTTTILPLSSPVQAAVTQISDASGRVLWSAAGGKVILEVKKITSDTYAGETTYTAEEFILLDIYPKTNGTVKVTYGGLTKTITDTSGAVEPNAQQVFFGTFNGVSDSVATPTSGTLTMDGEYCGIGHGSYVYNSKNNTTKCQCINSVERWGNVEIIPDSAFSHDIASIYVFDCVFPNSLQRIGTSAFNGNTNITNVYIPESVMHIGKNPWRITNYKSIDVSADNQSYKLDSGCLIEISTGRAINGARASDIPSCITSLDEYCFFQNENLVNITIPNGVSAISHNAFKACSNLEQIIISSNVTSICPNAFEDCDNLTSVTFNNTAGWWVNTDVGATSGTSVDVTNPANNAKLLTDTYKEYYWNRS